MNDISKLLQEAKPLYFARKKRNNRIKAVLCMLVLAIGLNFIKTPPLTDNSVYWAENMISMADSQILTARQESVIENMGLPVDEFGLLAVVG